MRTLKFTFHTRLERRDTRSDSVTSVKRERGGGLLLSRGTLGGQMGCDWKTDVIRKFQAEFFKELR